MSLPFKSDSFDFATAFMSPMDMPDQGAAGMQHRELKKATRPKLRAPIPEGFRDEEGRPRAVEVAGCFDRIDGRMDTWWFSTLPLEERQKDEPFRIPRFPDLERLG
jgi:hypothetical protein